MQKHARSPRSHSAKSAKESNQNTLTYSQAEQSHAGASTASPVAQLSAAHVMQLQSSIGNQAVAQLMQMQAKLEPPKENQTGMPDRLKAGVESLSGMDVSDVRVHHDSDKPSQVGALAYAQGNEIHVGPGQEEHLPHEAWHVVQQKQGRVTPTIQTKGMAINDQPSLEQEADEMGAKAVESKAEISVQPSPAHGGHQATAVMQQVNDYFPSGDKEPHIHIHDGGMTFTSVGHSHKTLVYGDQVRESAIMEVYQDLQALGTERAQQIIDWMEEQFGIAPPEQEDEQVEDDDEDLPADWVESETEDHNPEGTPPVGFSYGSYTSKLK